MLGLAVSAYGPDDINHVVDDMAALYARDFVPREVRDANPEFYSIERFRNRVLDDYANSPHFETVTVYDGDELVGFVTAANLIPDTRWWKVATTMSPDVDTHETGKRTLAIFDLLVTADRRGRGIGTLLHFALLTNRTEERITLLSSPPQQPAFAMWQHWGYKVIGRSRPDDSGPELDLFLRPVRQQST